MKILIVYGTYSGSTKVVGEKITEKLTKLTHTVTLQDMRLTKQEDFNNHDAYIFGTNTWFENKEEGMMNGAYLAFKEGINNKTLLNKKPSAVYALGDAVQYLQFCKSADHLEDMVRELDGNLVTPALRLSRYYFDPASKESEIDAWILKVAQGFTA